MYLWGILTYLSLDSIMNLLRPPIPVKGDMPKDFLTVDDFKTLMQCRHGWCLSLHKPAREESYFFHA